MVVLQFAVVIENNTVIIAASVPTLSPLWHKKSRRCRDAVSGSVPSIGQRRSRHEIFDGSKQLSHQASVILEDGRSEECILQELHDGIVKTTNVHVVYDGASESSRSHPELSPGD